MMLTELCSCMVLNKFVMVESCLGLALENLGMFGTACQDHFVHEIPGNTHEFGCSRHEK